MRQCDEFGFLHGSGGALGKVVSPGRRGAWFVSMRAARDEAVRTSSFNEVIALFKLVRR